LDGWRGLQLGVAWRDLGNIDCHGVLVTLHARITARIKDATARFGISALKLSGLYSGYWQHWRGPLFEYAESKGVHVLPVHYYSPIPGPVDRESVRRQNALSGLKIDIGAAQRRARSLIDNYAEGISSLLSGQGAFKPSNSSFAPLDAAILYGVIRDEKPRRIIEIGSGMSTIVMAAAVRDGTLETKLTCIEPYLPSYLVDNSFNAEIIERPLQDVSLDRFRSLEAGDILFIDSTHVVRFNSDVVYEILEILPILKPGVIVHVHDIFLPNDYPQEWLEESRFFWNEQYMLQAFLSMNANFQIEIPAHAIKADFDFSAISSTISTSFWMRRL
jgi:predicted O-methyltransferase YrrM